MLPSDTCPPAPDFESFGLMEPGRGPAPFSSAEWSFALPLAGHRMLAAFGTGCDARPGCRLRSRRGVEATRWFPEVTRALAALRRPGLTVVDGEVCAFDACGRSDARLLHERTLQPGRHPGSPPVVLVLRDLLAWEGCDVRTLPWTERQRLLAALPLQDPSALQLQRCAGGEGLWLARQAHALGLPGIDAFRRDAPYVAGPGIGWLRIPVGQALSPDQELAA